MILSLESVVKLPRWKKRVISIFTDVTALLFVAISSVWLRLGVVEFDLGTFWLSIIALPVLTLPILIKLGLYRAVIRYISHRFYLTVFAAVSLSFLAWAVVMMFLELHYPRSAFIIAWLMAILYITGSRLMARWALLRLTGEKEQEASIVIFGAGKEGNQLMQTILGLPTKCVVAFIDDDSSLHNQKIGSIKVYGRDDLESLIDRFNVHEVLMAVPHYNSVQRQEVLNWLAPHPVKVSTLPSLEEIVDGKVSFSDIREVSIEDLLGREEVPAERSLLDQCILDQIVFVSGGGGSIGSELCRQIIRQQPRKLLIYEISEFALYSIHHELEQYINAKHLDVEILPILGDVKNRIKLATILDQFNPDTIYHAAAYKHVPLVEHNIAEGIENNTFGTATIAELAAEKGVKNFVLVSTDKAVRPTNFMGASKRLAEMSLQSLQDKYSDTRFVMVRFGNVLGSSGSVIPLFKKQIEQGGPVTVTHKEITRYFMTIPEAASLVIQAGSMGVGGDVFVLDMGEPVKISQLAEKLIRLSGLEIIDSEGHGDIEIRYTGLRPGEKLYEELLIGDGVDGTEHPRIMKAHEDYLPYDEIQKVFEQLSSSIEGHDYREVTQLLSTTVSGFSHRSGIVDYISAGKNT